MPLEAAISGGLANLPRYILAFHIYASRGRADNYLGTYTHFNITSKERKEYPDLADVETLWLVYDNPNAEEGDL